MNTDQVIAAIDGEIERLQRAKEILSSSNGSVQRKPGRPRNGVSAAPVKPKRRLSAEARARIAAAQKARWAKAKKSTKN